MVPALTKSWHPARRAPAEKDPFVNTVYLHNLKYGNLLVEAAGPVPHLGDRTFSNMT